MVDLASRIGVVAVLLFGLVAIVNRWIVPGWAYSEMKAERDEWRKAAEDLRSVGRRGTEIADRTTSIAERAQLAAQMAAEIIQRSTEDRG